MTSHTSEDPEEGNQEALLDDGSNSGDADGEGLPLLPKHTIVVVTGNNRTKKTLVGQRGVVRKAVGLGGWHWLQLDTGERIRLQRNAIRVLQAPTGDEKVRCTASSNTELLKLGITPKWMLQSYFSAACLGAGLQRYGGGGRYRPGSWCVLLSPFLPVCRFRRPCGLVDLVRAFPELATACFSGAVRLCLRPLLSYNEALKMSCRRQTAFV